MYRSGWDRLDLLRREFDRMVDEMTGASSRTARGANAADGTDTQTVPVNIFETETELMVVAAMPGIEPPNVDIEVDENRVTIRGEKRGPGQERQRYHQREWTYGSYERTIDLPFRIDSDRARASYGNGVVTIAFPKTQQRASRKIPINPETVGASKS